MFYSPEGINQQSHSSPCYYPSTPESTPGWNSLVKFHFFAPFFILSIFQSPTWQKHNSLAGSGEMLRRGGVPHPPGGHAGSSQKRCHSPRSLFGTWAFSAHLIWSPAHRLGCSTRSAGEQLGCVGRGLSSSCFLNSLVEQFGCLHTLLPPQRVWLV